MTCTCNCKGYFVLTHLKYSYNEKDLRQKAHHIDCYSITDRKTALLQTGNHLTNAQNELYLICICMSTLNESDIVVKSCFSNLMVVL